MDSETERL